MNAPDAENDGELLDAWVRQSDDHAFAALVRRYAPLVQQACREVLSDRHAVDDAVQETFLALMRRAPGLHGDAPLAAWLRVTATSTARQLRRTNVRRLRREHVAASTVIASETTVAELPALPSGIATALDALPPEQRTALILRYIEERSEEEAARIVGCPQRTLHNRVMAGLSKLRQRLRLRGGDQALITLLALAPARAGSPLAPLAPLAPALTHAAPLHLLVPAITATLLAGGLATAWVVHGARQPAAPVPMPAPAALVASPAPDAPALAPTPPATSAPTSVPLLLSGPHAELTAVSVLPDGGILATGFDRALFRWGALDSATPQVVQIPGQGIRCMAVAPDGTWVALGNEDGLVRRCRLPDGAVLGTLSGHQQQVTAVAISPDGNSIASASKDGTVRLWDAGSGSSLATVLAHQEWADGIAWSPDGGTLASVGDDGALRTWDGRTLARRLEVHGHSSALRAVAWSPDGHTLASGGGDGVVRLWNAGTLAPLGSLATSPGMLMGLLFDAQGGWLAAVDRAGGCWQWSQPDGHLPHHATLPKVCLNAIAVTRDAGAVVVVGDDNVVRSWPMASWPP